MKKQFILLVGVCLSLFTATPAPTQADAASMGVTHFAYCASHGGVKIANGSWYRFEMGRTGGWVYGGSYVTSTRRINKSDHDSQGRGYLTIKGKKLKNTDGTWVDNFYLPLNQYDTVCN